MPPHAYAPSSYNGNEPMDRSGQYILPRAFYLTAVLLVIETVFMALLLNGALPFAKSLLLDYHTVVTLIVFVVASTAIAQAMRLERFSLPAALAFLTILVVFNPFYALLLTTQHAMIASAIAATLFFVFASQLAAM